MRYEISELLSDISMGPFGSNIKTDCYTEYGVPYLNGSNLTGYKLNETQFKYVSEEKADSLGRCVAHRGDIIVTHRGTLGQMSFIPEDSKFKRYVTGNSQFRFTCNKEIVLPEYLVYYFHSPIGQYKLLSNASQVGVPSLARPTSSFQKLEIDIPSIEEQKRIVAIISALEDKIELNTAINENLEQQAQALFKAWFVDFEPFGGAMPDDWRDISVYDLADYINGAAFKKAEYGESGLPIIKIAELKSGITDSTQYCCVHKDDKYYIDDRDILFSWSGNPDTSIDAFLWSRGKAILNQHTFRVVSKYNAPAFTYFLLKYLKPQFAHIASNKQTTGLGHVTVADLKRLQFCSNIATINEFEVLAAPIFNAIFAIYKENQHLADLRDTLLPKLMNGEIDVSEVRI